MLVTRELVERLEAVEAEVDARLTVALALTTHDPAAQVEPFGAGVLVASGRGRYVNRAVGVTLDELVPEDVERVIAWYVDRGLVPAVQLSAWAPSVTVTALSSAGFVPETSRSVLVRSTSAPGPLPAAGVGVAPVDAATAAAARDVMAGDDPDRQLSDEFMTADLASEGTVQLLARLHDRPVGCGSVTIIGGTAWLGAARTVPDTRRQGVQASLVAHRVDLARAHGCDLVGVTASVGSDSARNLQRLGFVLVQDQWVVEMRSG